MGLLTDLLGTSLTYFRIGINGIRLKVSGGKLAVRDANDTIDVEVTASKFTASGTQIGLNSAAPGSGGNFPYTLQAPITGMSAAVNFIGPPNMGSAGQVLGTDGTNTSWVSAASTAACVSCDQTTLNYNSTASLAMFTLPANAQIHKVQCIIITPWNTAATASVGESGNTSEFMGSSSLALNGSAGDVYEVNPTVAATGSTKALIITYAAASASTGSAQFLVYYSVPS